MDSARLARMADPDLNPQFRRRWVEPVALPDPAPVIRCIEHLGAELMIEHRRRAREAA